MNNFRERIEQTIVQRKLFRRREPILVAVSGGMDSMVLLHLLHALSSSHGWKISVAHFNHQLRGRSSDDDERFVQKIAGKLKLNFVAEHADVKTFARENKLSIEMAARQLRHEFFARTARKLRIKTIALGHHADDQVELFFLRLLRGAGTEGLSGMSWKSKSPADASLQLVRPFLDQPKEALLHFAQAEKISFRDDASNSSAEFQRNRIRLEVLPLLKTIQPAVRETSLRTMEIAAGESNFVLQAALDWLEGSKQRKPFDQLDVALQRVCLREQIRSLGFSAHFDLVEELRNEAGRIVAVDPRNSIFRSETGVVHHRTEQAVSFNQQEQKIVLAESNEIKFSDQKISWTIESKLGATFRRSANCEWFDADKIGAKIVLRHWKSGDRFQPIGMRSAKKLHDLFIDLKIPRAERHRKIVATTERGEIFWVEGLRISERFKLDNQSGQRLKWRLQPSVAEGADPC